MVFSFGLVVGFFFCFVCVVFVGFFPSSLVGN